MTKQLTVIEEEKIALREAGRELKTLLPGGANLSDNQAISLAKYAQVTKANPFRGEVYGYPDSKGNMQLVDGYKILVRWAKKVSNYSDKYELLAEGEEGTIKGDVAYRCWIMRHDLKNELSFYIQSGATFQEAYELVATSAVGLVTAGERKNAAPKGWTWDQQARKRALKNCLNLAYAMPSIDELAADSWQIGGTQTEPEDWQEVEIYKSKGEREKHAQLSAWNREAEENWQQTPPDERKAKTEASRNLMRDNGDDDPLALEDESEDDAGSVWLPDLEEFKEQCIFEYERDWPELEKVLRGKCGYGGDFEPAEATEMYQVLGSYLVSNE